ncbi:MAG: SMP-30/gluconolactonase/LRE family protein [Pirellulales bacterium]
MPPRVVCDYPCEIGENPLWHPDEGCLYWTDIPRGRLFRYFPATGKHEQVYQGRVVGGFTLQADGSLLLFMDRGTVAVWRKGEIVRTIIEELPEELNTRFNDVIADPEGRVYGGTMSIKDAEGRILRHGRFYRLDRDGSIDKLADGIGTSNGLGFTLDRRTLYYTDTGIKTIWQFDYDQKTGALANQRPFVKVPDRDGEGKPDGMTVDSQGDIWSARWDGSCCVRYSPAGVEQERLHFPTKRVSSVAFGGPELKTMYFTTAGGQDRAAYGATAGALYAVEASVPGVPEFRSRISV